MHKNEIIVVKRRVNDSDYYWPIQANFFLNNYVIMEKTQIKWHFQKHDQNYHLTK